MNYHAGLTLFFERGSLRGLGLTYRRWPGHWAPGTHLFLPPQHCYYKDIPPCYFFFFQGVGRGFSGLNAGPHVLPSKYFEEV